MPRSTKAPDRLAASRRLRLAVAAGCAAAAPLAIGTPTVLAAPLIALGTGAALMGRPRLVAAVAAAALAVVLVDLGGRLTFADALYHRAHERLVQAWPPWRAQQRYAPLAAVRRTTHGDLAAMLGDARLRVPREEVFRTDRLGFRNAATADARPLDVILVGDSFGAGIGTTQAATWAARLAAEHGLQTYSASMPGSPWHELLNLKTTLPQLHVRNGATVVWALFEGNDLDENYDARLDPPPRADALEQLAVRWTSFRRRSVLRQVWERWNASPPAVLRRTLPDGSPMLFLEEYAHRTARTRAAVEAHPNFPALQRVIAEMARFTSAHDLRVLVVLIPTKTRVYEDLLDHVPHAAEVPSGFASAIGAACDAVGLRTLDLAPILREAAAAHLARDGTTLWWHDDTHWNDLGHAIAAGAVARAIR